MKLTIFQEHCKIYFNNFFFGAVFFYQCSLGLLPLQFLDNSFHLHAEALTKFQFQFCT